MGTILNNFQIKFFFWFILRTMSHYFSDVCVYHSQTYPTVIFCKAQQKSHFVQDRIYTFGQLQLKFKPEHK